MGIVPSIYLIVLVITGGIGMLLLGTAIQRRAEPGARPFAVVLIFMILWVTTLITELIVADHHAKLFWFNLRQIAVDFYPVPWLAVAWEYYRRQRLTRRHLAHFVVLLIVPAISTVLVWTSGNHQLLRTSTEVVNFEGVGVVMVRSTGWFYVSAIYYSLMLAIVLYILIRATAHTSGYHRTQARLLVIGFSLQLLPVPLQIIGFRPIGPLGIIALSFIPTMLAMAFALYVLRLFDFTPIVRDRLVEAMSNGLLVFDEQYRLVDYNSLAEAIIREANPSLPRQLLGIPISDLLAPWPGWVQSAAHTDNWTVEITVGDDSSQRDYQVRSTPLSQYSSQRAGTLMLLEDITDHNLASERTLELALERKRLQILQTFIQSTSHDFRTPISIIKTASFISSRLSEQVEKHTAAIPTQEAAAEAAAALNKLRDRLDAIDTYSDRLASMLDDMLEIVRLEGVTSLDLEAVDVEHLVNRVVTAYAPKAAKHSLSLQTELNHHHNLLKAHVMYLQRAIHAILENAFQHTPPTGTITVRTTTEEARMVVEVEDTGSGIPAEQLPHIFTTTYRADPSRATTTGGAGLGLSLVKRIMELHGGSVEVDSEVGRGSTFRLLLPLKV